MGKPKSNSPIKPKEVPGRASPPDVQAVLDQLKKLGTKATRDGMARFGIPSDRAMGVTMGRIQALAKSFSKNHQLAGELWASGWYEARMLAAYLDDPGEVGSKQMDQWCAEFDNWAICDTLCFVLFDRTAHAWGKIKPWSRLKHEFPRRAAFALLWSLAVHDKAAPDASFLSFMPILERAAADERHYVKKAVSMALRAIGKRNSELHAKTLELAARLVVSSDATAAWIGRDVQRDLGKPAVQKRFTKKKKATPGRTFPGPSAG